MTEQALAIAKERLETAKRIVRVGAKGVTGLTIVALCETVIAQAEAIERWAGQALKEEECRRMWQARADNLTAELAEARAELARMRT